MANKTEHIYTGLLSLFLNYYFNVLFLSFKGQKVDTDFFVLVLMAFILCASFTRMQCRIFLRGKQITAWAIPFIRCASFTRMQGRIFDRKLTVTRGKSSKSVRSFHQDAAPHFAKENIFCWWGMRSFCQGSAFAKGTQSYCSLKLNDFM